MCVLYEVHVLINAPRGNFDPPFLRSEKTTGKIKMYFKKVPKGALKLTQKLKIHLKLSGQCEGGAGEIKFGAEHGKVKGYTHAYKDYHEKRVLAKIS